MHSPHRYLKVVDFRCWKLSLSVLTTGRLGLKMPLLMSAYTPRALESFPKLQTSNTGSLASVSYGLLVQVSRSQWTEFRRYSYGPSPLACTHKHVGIQLNISTNQNPLITHAPSLYISHTIPSAACPVRPSHVSRPWCAPNGRARQ